MPTRGEGGSKRPLAGLDLEAHLLDPATKQRYVTPLFDVIAPRYDRFTRLFSFGMDAGWKRELLDHAPARLPADPVVLDLGCGTGDLAFALAGFGRAFGFDASARMIDAAVARRVGGGPVFGVGDMMRLPIASGSVDVVTAGYALRNTPDFRVALREIARVVRPGGRLLTLDFYRPSAPVWRAVFLRYLSVAGSSVGWLWHREPDVYRYIARSIEHYVSVGEFTDAVREAGFEVEVVSVKLFGGVAIHTARRGG